MIEWEYKHLVKPRSDDYGRDWFDEITEYELNDYGAQGWEVIQVRFNPHDYSIMSALLKREIEE